MRCGLQLNFVKIPDNETGEEDLFYLPEIHYALEDFYLFGKDMEGFDFELDGVGIEYVLENLFGGDYEDLQKEILKNSDNGNSNISIIINYDWTTTYDYEDGRDDWCEYEVVEFLELGGNVENTVTITEKEYKNLKIRDLKLSALEQEGVDNWVGYDEAMKVYRNWKEAEVGK
ncbi:MAG: hypothetical protein HQK53_16480 [Oligoflexia bacterium]|nr:hypothetical protein [Oligoflexia bacterium]